MADNVAYTPGSGATVAADDIGGVLHQRVKLSVGPDGSATDASLAAPVPTMPGQAGTHTLSSVNDSASNATLLSANSARKGVLMFNASLQALYVKYGATASIAAGGYTFMLEPGGYWEMPSPIYAGQIDGIWEANSSEYVNITEIT